MEFYVSKDRFNNTRILYLKEEMSLYLSNNQVDCSLAINNLYLTIDFNIYNKSVMGISGFLSDINSFNNKHLEIPNIYDEGVLYFVDNKIYEKGIAYEFYMNENIVYDKENNILLIGEDSFNKNISFYKVAENMFVGLYDKKISTIMVDLNEKK